jgi:hypothetical protein
MHACTVHVAAAVQQAGKVGASQPTADQNSATGSTAAGRQDGGAECGNYKRNVQQQQGGTLGAPLVAPSGR